MPKTITPFTEHEHKLMVNEIMENYRLIEEATDPDCPCCANGRDGIHVAEAVLKLYNDRARTFYRLKGKKNKREWQRAVMMWKWVKDSLADTVKEWEEAHKQ